MKINKFFIAISILIAATMVACEEYEDVVEPSPVVPADNPAVRFTQDNETSFELDPNADPSFTLTLERSNESAALDVPVTVVVNTENSFNVPGSVSFAAGKKTAELVIEMNAGTPTGVPLTLELKFEDQYVNPYLTEYGYYIGEVSLLKWVKYATGVFTSGFFEQSWDQDLYRAEGTNKYRFYDLFVAGVNYEFEWDGGLAISPGGTPNASGYLVQESGYVHPTYGMVSSTTDPDTSYTYYDADSDTFVFNRQWTVADGSFGWLDDYYQITERY
jgi:hypothetical protein